MNDKNQTFKIAYNDRRYLSLLFSQNNRIIIVYKDLSPIQELFNRQIFIFGNIHNIFYT